jgi:hypothetical protein
LFTSFLHHFYIMYTMVSVIHSIILTTLIGVGQLFAGGCKAWPPPQGVCYDGVTMVL